MSDGPQPQPLPRALAVVRTGEPGESITAVTDADGRCIIRDLGPGSVSVIAIKAGYLTMAYGAKRAGRPGSQVVLAAGSSETIRLALTRGAVVSGTVRDDLGLPLSDVRVFAIDTHANAPALNPGASVLSDDEGRFRIFGLAPGEYVVGGSPSPTAEDASAGAIVRYSTEEIDSLLADLEHPRPAGGTPASDPRQPGSAEPTHSYIMAPAYFENSTTLASADRIRLQAGEERDGLDFVVAPAPATEIDGTIDGTVSHVELSIAPADAFPGFVALPRLVRAPDMSGSFTYADVVPGHYVVTARAILSGRTVYGVGDVDVDTSPAVVAIRLQPGGRLTGRIVIDAEPNLATPSTLSPQIRLGITPTEQVFTAMSGGTRIGNVGSRIPPVVPQTDGTFDIEDIAPGSYRVGCIPANVGCSAGWWLRSVMVGGRDVLDGRLDVTPGADFRDAVVTLSNRHSEIFGRLESAPDRPTADYYIVVIPADPGLWVAGSRRLRAVLPATDGHFSLVDLPPGNYLLGVLADVDDTAWETHDSLVDIAAHGVAVRLGEGEKRRQDLRVERPPRH